MIFDDIIVAAQDEQEHDEIMKKLLERAKVKNVKFNPDKLQYKVKEVKYNGWTKKVPPPPMNILVLVYIM